MKFTAVISLLSCASLMAQTGTIAWVRPIYGSGVNAALQSQITDLDNDPAGNTYITGEFRSKLDFGSGMTLEASGTNAAFFLAKYAPNGTVLWARKAQQQMPSEGSSFIAAPKISTDAAGNVYWCGNYKAQSLDFGNNVIITRSCTNDCQEGFLLKLNAEGTIVFQKALRAALGQEFSVNGVASAPDGAHVITGAYTGTELWLQGGANIGGLESSGFFLGYYNPAGAAEWIGFQNPNTGLPQAEGLAMSPDGKRIVVAGKFSAPKVDFGNGSVVTSDAAHKNFYLWYNTMGQAIGAGALDASEALDWTDLRVDQDYAAWTTITYKGKLRWKETDLATGAFSTGNQALIKLSPTGVQKSEDLATGTVSSPLNSFVLGYNGIFYGSGYTKENLSVPGANNLIVQGCSDLVWLKGQDLQYTQAWAVGKNGCELAENPVQGTLMGLDGNGNLHLAGHFNNGAQLGPNTLGGTGLWVAKVITGTSPAGEPEPQMRPLELYPNPVAARLYFSEPLSWLRVYSVDGGVVQTLKGENLTALDLIDLQKGVYLLQSDKGAARFVKN